MDDFGDAELDNLLGTGDKPKNKAVSTSYSWTADEFQFEYNLNCYCIQKAIKELDKNCFFLSVENSSDFEYDLGKSENIVKTGAVSFHYKKKNFVVSFDNRSGTAALSSNSDIIKVRDYFEEYISKKNPLRGKNIQIYEKRGDMTITFHPVDELKWEDMIIDPEMKDDIYSNTIFQMKNFDMNNGIILFGKPGSGKSRCAKSLVYESIRAGFSSCFVTSRLNFTQFGIFLGRYLNPCLVVFEDVDTFAQDRKAIAGVEIADFLQLISGLGDDATKTIFVATTNHINFLDDAVKSRPCRFARKYKFDYPKDNEVSKIIDSYFDNQITEDLKKLCYGVKFCGSHIKELLRTCEIMNLKNKNSSLDNFEEAVRVVRAAFESTESDSNGYIGFSNVTARKL